MEQGYKVAVVGATGMVGETILEILEQREFPVDELFLLASSNSVGKSMQFSEKSYRVTDVDEFDFSNAQIAFFTAGSLVSEEYAQVAADQGCIVIDNTSCFRYEYDVPLVIPEVNPEKIADFRNRGIIANPNCSTIQMLLALAPIHRHASIKRINVATYQAVSGSGKKGIQELAGQTAKLLNAQTPENKVYPKQIAFNVLPQIDDFQDNGYTKEEMKMVWETQKILGDESVRVNPTCVRVPVFFGHSEAVHVECWDSISAEEVKELMVQTPGIELVDEQVDGGYATAVSDAAKNDDVFVSRVREDISCENAINMWVVADNVRKGAALNSVQIAEILVQQYI
ncbi:aspartate-semialdehyde dehydrogenase [Neptuniibacter sp. 2_MG-2023]|uniref:aspartate-semialdehyde dehydrogenase n=1 Tax=Neptuniibacter sp. 2_MG-2023 TaxID=3062671 RepID=UPI0026E3576F|nr:aspartate-semialdehyde dehydrogenase [Neptuniibacter sp. 2_MG-2023]MDO6513214.1 aspartate-semialdehyde dehydrogenase [Neptuniibacter sp. 2_MG-2023]